MSMCPACGAEVQGRFCARCGAPASAPQQQPPPPQPQQQYQQSYPQQPQGNPQGWQQQPPPPNYGNPQGGYQQPPQYAQPPAAQSAGLDENVASALCYLLGLITGVLFLVLEPYNTNKTVRFHAFQSIFFNVAYVVLWIVLTIVFGIMREVLPYGVWFLFGLISTLFSLAMLAAWVFLMYKAYNRERFKIPVIGDMAEKQA